MADFNATQSIPNFHPTMIIAWPHININANPFVGVFDGVFANGTYSKICNIPVRGQKNNTINRQRDKSEDTYTVPHNMISREV